jgi:hypothetical protein
VKPSSPQESNALRETKNKNEKVVRFESFDFFFSFDSLDRPIGGEKPQRSYTRRYYDENEKHRIELVVFFFGRFFPLFLVWSGHGFLYFITFSSLV